MDIKKIKSMLTETDYLPYNKELVRELGHAEAMVYTELYNRGDDWFLCTIDDLEYECSVKRSTQAKYLKDLQDRGLIEVKHKGMPKRRYIKVVK